MLPPYLAAVVATSSNRYTPCSKSPSPRSPQNRPPPHRPLPHPGRPLSSRLLKTSSRNVLLSSFLQLHTNREQHRTRSVKRLLQKYPRPLPAFVPVSFSGEGTCCLFWFSGKFPSDFSFRITRESNAGSRFNSSPDSGPAFYGGVFIALSKEYLRILNC